MKKIACACLVTISLLFCSGCGKPPQPAASPRPPVAMPTLGPEVDEFLLQLANLKLDLRDQVVTRYQQARDSAKRNFVATVKAEERKMRAEEVRKTLLELAPLALGLEKKVTALAPPPNCVEVKQHFLAHIKALEKEMGALDQLAQAWSLKDPPKDAAAAQSKLDAAEKERNSEYLLFQEEIKRLAKGTPSP